MALIISSLNGFKAIKGSKLESSIRYLFLDTLMCILHHIIFLYRYLHSFTLGSAGGYYLLYLLFTIYYTHISHYKKTSPPPVLKLLSILSMIFLTA